jgi:hypothetical protein
MRTRIKYFKYNDILVTDWFTIGPNNIVRGIVTPSDNSYSVITFDSQVVYEGTTPSLRNTKETVRLLLSKLGVKFEGEIRS